MQRNIILFAVSIPKVTTGYANNYPFTHFVVALDQTNVYPT